ncbi:hypothetical protein J1N35_010102 [Gossypium stocksii]|uniref:Uncharacterized protein n=1 Tax=Gossypium stocksii TaxID=47602 RepID=A0A9D4ABQ5_9ROSI|nr:hypothetical protein J1N35_010102 [Gossypium stocksii]
MQKLLVMCGQQHLDFLLRLLVLKYREFDMSSTPPRRALYPSRNILRRSKTRVLYSMHLEVPPKAYLLDSASASLIVDAARGGRPSTGRRRGFRSRSQCQIFGRFDHLAHWYYYRFNRDYGGPASQPPSSVYVAPASGVTASWMGGAPTLTVPLHVSYPRISPRPSSRIFWMIKPRARVHPASAPPIVGLPQILDYHSSDFSDSTGTNAYTTQYGSNFDGDDSYIPVPI